MLLGMNATAQASVAPTTGPKLDNRRVLAAVVDLAIVVTGALVILAAGDALSSDSSDVRGALSVVILGWALYYYFALESGEGQTVGKKLMKLRVVRADGRPAGMREIAVRTVLRVVDGIGVYIVGLIAMLVSGQRRQRLGDMAAGTIVVDASAPAYVPPAPVEAPSVEDEPVEDEVEAEVEMNSVNDTPTITLPSRPAPATIDDLSAPEAPPVPEMRPFDPPAAEEEPAVEAEPVAVEPVAVEEPVAVRAGRGRARRRRAGRGRAGRRGRGRRCARRRGCRAGRGCRRGRRRGPSLTSPSLTSPSPRSRSRSSPRRRSTSSLRTLRLPGPSPCRMRTSR